MGLPVLRILSTEKRPFWGFVIWSSELWVEKLELAELNEDVGEGEVVGESACSDLTTIFSTLSLLPITVFKFDGDGLYK